MVWSFVYLALRRSRELVLLCYRSAEANAAREPEFRAEMDRFHNAMVTIARRGLAADDPDRFWEWTARLAPGAASREPATARRQRRQLDESEPDESEPRSAPAAPLPRPCGARGVPLVDCWISRRTSAYQR